MSISSVRITRRTAVLAVAAGLLTGAATLPAAGAPSSDPVRDSVNEPVTGAVERWIERTAVPIDSVEPGAPLGDLAHLAPLVADATVVGLGEQAHGVHEVLQLKHRVLRLLVERHGFRSIAWEDDWTLGLEIDRWTKTGEGDLDALVGQLSTAHRNAEVKQTLRWLREFNAAHPADPVTFVGVEYWTTRHSAYDAVEAYVADNAPARLREARQHLDFLRPPGDEIGDWPELYGQLKDHEKAPYLRHARDLSRLMRELPHDPEGIGGREFSLAAHHARQIRNFYEHFALWPNHVYRDEHAAENLRWWEQYSGDKVVYWAANAHTAVAPKLDIYVDGGLAASWASVGSFLKSWYGTEYRSIGFVFDRGSYYQGKVLDLPAAPEPWYEHALAGTRYDQFSLDLRARAPRPVQRWLNAPARSRGLPEYGLASYMTGGSVAEWFDVLVYRRVVTAATPGAPSREVG